MTVDIEQHVWLPAREQREGPVLVARIVEGRSQGDRLFHGGLPVWWEDERRAIDLREIIGSLPPQLISMVAGLEDGLVQWDPADHRAERAIRELFRLHLMSDPGQWLRMLASLSPELIDNSALAESVMITVPVPRLLDLLALPVDLLDDVVRNLIMGNGAPPHHPTIDHIISGAEPRLAKAYATIAATFADDGSIQVIQIAIDLQAWVSAVEDRDVEHEFPVVMWQTYERSSGEIAMPPFPDEATDITSALHSLPSPSEQIAGMIAADDQPEMISPLTPAATPADLPPRSAEFLVDPLMLADLRNQSGAMTFALRDADPQPAARALTAMVAAIGALRHPDEPSGALASFISDVTLTADGGWFWADISDMADEDDVLADIVTTAAAAALDHLDDGMLSARRE